MKKKYVKPELIVEEFVLSTAIASCDFKYTNSQDMGCAAIGKGDYSGWTIFNGEPCNVPPEVIEDLCYQTGEDGSNTWMS